MKYRDFSAEDFLLDEKFVYWVRTNDTELAIFWENWLSQNPDRREVVMEARSILLNLDFTTTYLSQPEKEDLWEKIKPDQEAIVIPIRQKKAPWMKLAAVLLVLVMTGLGIWLVQQNKEYTERTTFAEQKIIELVDGSKVTLNANSELTYSHKNPRKVWLKGEAYFEIQKDQRKGTKFEVITEDLTVNVLGTVFNVNSRNDTTSVFLEEGKVRLKIDRPTANALELVPGEWVSYSKRENHLSEKKKVQAIENTSWKDGTLVFRDATLPTVFKKLTEFYGVEFLIEDQALAKKRITGGVPIGNLRIALETLSGIYDIQVIKIEDKYHIRL
ncbi:MAG: FecR domain-containing protein [Bacteroidota bacterium]